MNVSIYMKGEYEVFAFSGCRKTKPIQSQIRMLARPTDGEIDLESERGKKL